MWKFIEPISFFDIKVENYENAFNFFCIMTDEGESC